MSRTEALFLQGFGKLHVAQRLISPRLWTNFATLHSSVWSARKFVRGAFFMSLILLGWDSGRRCRLSAKGRGVCPQLFSCKIK